MPQQKTTHLSKKHPKNTCHNIRQLTYLKKKHATISDNSYIYNIYILQKKTCHTIKQLTKKNKTHVTI